MKSVFWTLKQKGIPLSASKTPVNVYKVKTNRLGPLFGWTISVRAHFMINFIYILTLMRPALMCCRNEAYTLSRFPSGCGSVWRWWLSFSPPFSPLSMWRWWGEHPPTPPPPPPGLKEPMSISESTVRSQMRRRVKIRDLYSDDCNYRSVSITTEQEAKRQSKKRTLEKLHPTRWFRSKCPMFRVRPM